MGLIWDIIQHGQIRDATDRTASVEHRVSMLEQQLRQTNQALMQLLKQLEKRFGEDLDQDGRIG